MDFWSRLIGGGGIPPSKQPHIDSAPLRLVRFKRATEYIQQTCRKSRNRPIDFSTIEHIRSTLDVVVSLLQDESKASVPHLCIQATRDSQIYKASMDLAIATSHEGIICGSLALLNTLVESDEGSFLDKRAFATAVTDFAKDISVPGLIGTETEALLFEVLFSVAAKLKLQPECLRCWFKRGEEHRDGISKDRRTPSSISKDNLGDFALFSILLGHVHDDGKVGEFARTGLLYIVESAARSEWLEKWIIESDLATLMATGLGGLYSQLGRKLVVSYPKALAPSIVAFSDELRPLPAFDAVETSSLDFTDGISRFLKYLIFWQDILESCTSDDIRQTLLDHFEFLFLKQLLYPSLLESSDRDGGFVAVLTYLRCILLNVNHLGLTHRILHYLLARPDLPTNDNAPSRPVTLARRRKSETLIRRQAENLEDISPGLYTLEDIVLGGLRSGSQQTVAATLRLFSTILGTRHSYAVPGLIKVLSVKEISRKRSVSAHDRDVDTLLSIAKDLIDETTDECYGSHLQDARILLEGHVCSADLHSLPTNREVADQPHLPGGHSDWPRRLCEHTIDPQGSMLRSMLTLLSHFFSNDIETNLSLTQAFSTLASCSYTRLEGWFLDDHIRGGTPQQDSEAPVPVDFGPQHNGKDDSNKASLQNRTLTANTEHTSPLMRSLDLLADQVDRFRQEVEDFDIYLAERKHVFRVGEEIESALRDVPASSSSRRGSKAASPDRSRAPDPVLSISERLLSNEDSASVSRASSPRGRQRDAPSMPTLVGRLSHLRMSPSPSPSKNVRVYASPLRRDSFSSTPSKNLRSPANPASALNQRLRVPMRSQDTKFDPPDTPSSEVSSVRSDFRDAETGRLKDFDEVSLSKVLTNIVILQEFVLELAAIVEVRAGLLGEVAVL